MPRIQSVKCFEFGEFMEETMWAGAVREGFLEELSLGVRPGRNQQGHGPAGERAETGPALPFPDRSPPA